MSTLTSTLDAIATNGTAPTTGNSNISATANNAAPTIFASTDIAPPHAGLTVTKYSMASSVAALVGWDPAKWTATPAGLNLYHRFYLYLGAAPGATVYLASSTNTGFSVSSSVRLLSTRRLGVFGTASSNLGSMTTVIPIGQWVRIETVTFMDASVGTITIKLYLSPESTTPDETFTSSAGNTLSAQSGISRVCLGNVGGGTTATHYFADSAWSDVGPLGPLAPRTLGTSSPTSRAEPGASPTARAGASSSSTTRTSPTIGGVTP